MDKVKNPHYLYKEYGTGQTGQSRYLFWQIFFSHPIPADTKAAAPFDDLLGELVQILPPNLVLPKQQSKLVTGSTTQSLSYGRLSR